MVREDCSSHCSGCRSASDNRDQHVIYYAPTIFKFTGITAAGAAILAGAGLAMMMWCFHVPAIFLLDRVGRSPLLLTGVAGQIVGLAILGTAFQFQQLGSFKSYAAIGGLNLCRLLRLRADLLAADF